MFFDIFHLSDFLGLFEVSIMFFLMFFDFCWGVLVDFLDLFGTVFFRSACFFEIVLNGWICFFYIWF